MGEPSPVKGHTQPFARKKLLCSSKLFTIKKDATFGARERKKETAFVGFFTADQKKRGGEIENHVRERKKKGKDPTTRKTRFLGLYAGYFSLREREKPSFLRTATYWPPEKGLS